MTKRKSSLPKPYIQTFSEKSLQRSRANWDTAGGAAFEKMALDLLNEHCPDVSNINIPKLDPTENEFLQLFITKKIPFCLENRRHFMQIADKLGGVPMKENKL